MYLGYVSPFFPYRDQTTGSQRTCTSGVPVIPRRNVSPFLMRMNPNQRDTQQENAQAYDHG